MKLWTNHPRCFLIDKITEIDPTKSLWWTYDDPGFRYREVLPILWDKLKTKHFLWCASCQGEYYRTPDQNDLVEWELDVIPSSVLAFFDVGVWDKIVHSKSDDWTALFVTEIAESLPKHIGALVAVPLSVMAVRCLGPSPPVKIYDKNGKLRHF
jgi:hypothetical protein